MLRVDGLHAYYGPSHVLHGVTLEVPSGGVAGILGRNGVGKTTTLRAIMGFVAASAGRVMLGDRDISGWAPHAVARAGVAYVPEGRQIFPALTAAENLRLGERRPSRRARSSAIRSSSCSTSPRRAWPRSSRAS